MDESLASAVQLTETAESENSSVIVSEDFGLEDLFDAIECPNNELVIRIDEILGNLKPSMSSKCCIYRVPPILRQWNGQAYTPRVVSIGPFHHGVNERYRSMDELKKRYFNKLLKRSKTRLRKYVQIVKDFEGRARECYAEAIEMESDDFVSMMLIDACFVIELLLRWYFLKWNKEDGHVLSTPWLKMYVVLDLLLLENQIPFFVLEKIFSEATASVEVPTFRSVALEFFKCNGILDIGQSSELGNHFTDLILHQHRSNSKRRPETDTDSGLLYSATELEKAGVKFQVGESKCLLDINFSEGVLTIPKFKVDDYTETIIRNLIALELCHYPNDNYIMDFSFFMDYLINTSSDIDLLIKKEIIVNYLGDSSTARDLFNNLCKDIEFGDTNFYFSDVCEQLNAYCDQPMHEWKATGIREYLSTPWKLASTIAAIVLLGLTLIQTITGW